MKLFFTKLSNQLLIPTFIFFIIVTSSSMIIARRLQTQVENSHYHSLLSSNLSKVISSFNELRINSKMQMLAFILTGDIRFANTLSEIEDERKQKQDDLYKFLKSHELFKNEVSEVRSSHEKTFELRKEITILVRKNEFKKAMEYFNIYASLYDLNSARLSDIRSKLSLELSNSNITTKDFYNWLLYAIITIILFSICSITASFFFYQRNLILPIKQLKKGLKELNRGIFPTVSTKKFLPKEIEEIIDNFNITSRTLEEVEKELLEANQESHSLAQIKTDFLSNMSHEIRTPLNSIIGMSQLLSDFEHTDKVKKYIDTIRNSSNLLLNIVNDILDLSKLDSGKIDLQDENCNPRELAHRICSGLDYIMQKKSLELKIEFCTKVPEFILCDPYRVEQMLLNLLSNAVKFTERGSVTLQTSKATKNGKSFIEFTVKDTGIGIHKDKLNLLFERFTQENSSISKNFEGTGLGLAITKELVDLMQGEIRVSSELGLGSAFTISIPLIEPTTTCSSTHKASNKNQEKKLLSKPITILIVDDSIENRILVKLFLESQPITFLEATNGLEAIEIHKKNKIDLILMDLQMPKMDGITATMEIKKYEAIEKLKSTPIIALSAYVEKVDIQKSRDAGCYTHLNKPIDRELLISTIIEVIDKNLS